MALEAWTHLKTPLLLLQKSKSIASQEHPVLGVLMNRTPPSWSVKPICIVFFGGGFINQYHASPRSHLPGPPGLGPPAVWTSGWGPQRRPARCGGFLLGRFQVQHYGDAALIFATHDGRGGVVGPPWPGALCGCRHGRCGPACHPISSDLTRAAGLDHLL